MCYGSCYRIAFVDFMTIDETLRYEKELQGLRIGGRTITVLIANNSKAGVTGNTEKNLFKPKHKGMKRKYCLS